MSFRIFVFSFMCLGFMLGVLEYSWAQHTDNQDLILYEQDVRIEEVPEAGGFFLYVRKKQSMNSVMLTESAETPSRDSNTYAYITDKYNNINGNEKRVLNGRFIRTRSGFFIVDSSPDADVHFGSAFVLFLPYELRYGYEDTRHGSINLKEEGMYMSIRAFEKPYANYEGAYQDNSFYLERVIEEKQAAEVDDSPSLPPDSVPEFSPVVIATVSPEGFPLPAGPDAFPSPENNPEDFLEEVVPEDEPKSIVSVVPEPPNPEDSVLQGLLSSTPAGDKYSPDTVKSFTEIAAKANSNAIFIENKNDIVDKIGGILQNLPDGESADIVILLDTTRSMWDDLAVLKSRLIPTVSKIMKGRIYRIGLVFYRDRGEEYITKRIEFSDQLEVVQRTINSTQAGGGGDWPEAVYEALEVGVNKYTWIAENRVIFIVGDAPPHDPMVAPAKSSVDLDALYSSASSKKIVIYPMIVPKID